MPNRKYKHSLYIRTNKEVKYAKSLYHPGNNGFDEQGRLDPDGNFRLYDFIKNSVSGFVVMGSTGEFFSLDMKTSRQIIQMAAEFPVRE